MNEHAANGGYTDEDWERVKAWPAEDCAAMLAFVKARWWAADWGWSEGDTEEGRLYSISTAGWSDNEEWIGALRENVHHFWTFCWHSQRRGGHFEFLVPRPWVR